MNRPRPALDILAMEADDPSPPHDHVVQFYDDETTLVQVASAYLAGGLLRGCPAVVISETRRLPLFEAQLAGMGVDVAEAVDMRQLLLIDARDMLARFMVDGVPEPRLFRKTVGSLVASTTEIWRPARLHAYGDMVDLLWADGNSGGALALEELWNDLSHRQGFALFCAYSARHFERDDQRAGFDAVCGKHGRILPIDGLIEATG